MKRPLTFAVLALLLSASSMISSATAADWPQWRGENRDDMNSETGLLKSWPEGGPSRLWLFDDCGVGYSGPAVVKGKLYLMGARDDQELLFCLDARTGAELWATPLGEYYENNWGDGPRGTPTVVDNRVYAIAAKGNVVCLDASAGRIVWTTSMIDDLGGELPVWGYSESPLVMGGSVFCTPGGDDGAIAALDEKTGELQWQASEVTGTSHYSSIVVQELGDRTTLVQLLPDQLVGVDPHNGDLLWSEPWPGEVAVIPTPVVSGPFVYVTSGYGVGCMLVRVNGPNDATKIYENKVMKNHHGGVILRDGHLFGHSDSVGWVCQDLESGERVWRERSALGKGAIAYADGRFYCLSEDDGEVVLIEASTDGWKEHGRFTLDPQTKIRKKAGKIWTHPVISDGRLYLRDQDLVYCFDVRQSPGNATAQSRR